ncbi:hypothetical protein AAY473_003994 [Plecturocebus cupreus]
MKIMSLRASSPVPLLEYSGMILAHGNLGLSGSIASPASTSHVAGIAGTHHHTWLIFVFLVEMGFHHVVQAGLEPLTSGDLPASASQSAGITCVSYLAQPEAIVLNPSAHQASSYGACNGNVPFSPPPHLPGLPFLPVFWCLGEGMEEEPRSLLT